MIKVGLVLSAVGAVLLLAGPLGSRFGVWPFLVGFLMLAVSLLLGLVGVSLAFVACVKTGSWMPGMAGILAGLAVVSVPSFIVVSARGAPPINDITTDPADPPSFVAILPLRAGAPNPPEYAGSPVADQQRAAYPDVKPLVLQMDAGRAFDRALMAVRGLGWEVVADDKSSGRIEAVDTTFWFGFKDDVVVRVREDAGGARIDVRSKSRVGVGDVGTNARRIRELLRRIAESR